MKNQFKREKAYLGIIDKLIIIFIGIAIIFLAITSITSYKDMKRNLLEVYYDNLNNRIDELVESFDSYFNNKFDNLDFLAMQPEVYNMDRSKQREYLKDKAKPLGFEKLFVMDNDGMAYYVKQDILKNQSGEYFTEKVLSEDRYISEPFMEYTLHRSITTMSVDILNENGEKVGAICGTVDLEKVNFKIEEFKLGKDGFGLIINDNGQYIAYKDMMLVHSKENFVNNYADYDDDLDLLANRDKIIEDTGNITLDNVAYCAAYKKLGVNDWTVIILVPKAEVLVELGPYMRTQVLNIIIVSLLILLVSKVLYNWIYNEHKAYTDGLTKIFNREKCDIILDKVDKYTKSRIIIICLDLNNFKNTNDLEGHAAGDKLLQDFAKILNNVFGKIGFVSRIGGDEFLVILRNATDKDISNYIKTMNKRIAVYNNNYCKDKESKLSTAYGIAIKECNETIPISELKEKADSEMYKNKNKDKDI